jgi:hypothetical protein
MERTGMAEQIGSPGYEAIDDVYRRLQHGYVSRSRELRFFGIVSTLLVFWLARDQVLADQFAFIALLWTMVLGFRIFVENSNLNHLMQQIEWWQTIR